MFIFTLSIDPTSKVPVYTQIYKYIRSEIEGGRLSCGTKLASTRKLGAHLSVSRNTLDMAYGQLIDEGYIQAFPKRGYFVCDISTNLGAIPKLSENAPISSAAEKKPGWPYDFSPYGVDLSHFPYSSWRKTMRDILYDDRNLHLFETGHPQGDLDFRQAIASYLHQSRGVVCTPDQIIVGAGIDYLLLLLTQLLGRHTIFALEAYSYMQAGRILSAIGCPIRAIPLDRHGMNTEALCQSDADVAYITPSHHFPLGIVMPIKRRQEILRWALEDSKRYIIEDDYDSEFRYKGRPIPSLQGIDTAGKVIYLGTFSKAIAPSIRISYIVLPQTLLSIYKKQYFFYSNTVPRTEQKQLTQFITRGLFQRHLNRMRNIYKAKRDFILKALEPYMEKIEINGENSGLHLLITFKDGRSTRELIKIAADHGMHLFSTDDYLTAGNLYTGEKFHSTLILGYASIPQEKLGPAMDTFIQVFF